MRVRLSVDLTDYDKRLTAGQLGDAGHHSRLGDRFTGVRFDCGAYLDVLWKSLDIIDADYLARVEESRKKKEAAIAKARNVVLRLGPRGGFQSLSFEYEGGHESCGFRDTAERYMEIMRANGIEIREEREKPMPPDQRPPWYR